MSECSECWRDRQGTSYSATIDIVLPIIERLRAKLGSNQAICEAIGVSPNQISVIHRQEKVRGTFIDKLIALDKKIHDQDQDFTRFWNRGDPLGCWPEPLGTYLREFCRQWISERPYMSQSGRTNTYFVGPQDFIANRAGISVREVGRICNSLKEFVPLNQVDAILTAINRYDLLDNEIKVVTNPKWSLEAYIDYMKERGCI